jgi:MarR family transcriptional regulator, transcriptional regulator for hemolysin
VAALAFSVSKLIITIGWFFAGSVIDMKLERSFGYLVHDVARLFARRFNQRALLFLGLTRSQCRVLGYLARHEGINQAGLADLLEIKPMTLVRQLDRMEEDGWVERRPDPGDRRARRLVLTEKARPILARILDLSSEVRREAFANLSDEEGRHLIDLLRRVHGNLYERVPSPAVTALPKAAAPSDRPAQSRARAAADLSPVGGHQ